MFAMLQLFWSSLKEVYLIFVSIFICTIYFFQKKLSFISFSLQIAQTFEGVLLKDLKLVD